MLFHHHALMRTFSIIGFLNFSKNRHQKQKEYFGNVTFKMKNLHKISNSLSFSAIF